MKESAAATVSGLSLLKSVSDFDLILIRNIVTTTHVLIVLTKIRCIM